jgi:hypothetical protein
MNTIQCNECERHLPETDFAFKNKATGLRNTKCKSCQRAYAKAHYAANTEKYVERAGRRNRKVKDAYTAVLKPLLAAGRCTCCGVRAGEMVNGKPARLVFVRKKGYRGEPLHDIIREKRSQAAFDKALKHSELKCDACAFTPYAQNLAPAAQEKVAAPRKRRSQPRTGWATPVSAPGVLSPCESV